MQYGRAEDDLIYSIGEGDDNFTGGVVTNILVAAGGNDLVVAGSLIAQRLLVLNFGVMLKAAPVPIPSMRGR